MPTRGEEKKERCKQNFWDPSLKAGGEAKQEKAGTSQLRTPLSVPRTSDRCLSADKKEKKNVDDEDDATFWILIKALSFSKVSL